MADDKIAQAQDYLLGYGSSTQEFEAALEHLIWVKDNKPEDRPAVSAVVQEVIRRRRDEPHTMTRLRQAFG